MVAEFSRLKMVSKLVSERKVDANNRDPVRARQRRKREAEAGLKMTGRQKGKGMKRRREERKNERKKDRKREENRK